MELKLTRHLWGVAMPVEAAVAAFAAEGYGGIECPLDLADATPTFRELLDAHGLDYLAQGFTSGSTVAEHVAAFGSELKRAEHRGVSKLIVQGGKDAFTDAEAARYFAEVLAMGADSPVEVNHETHRGMALFNPWRTRDLLEKFPALLLCCDFSHFVNVAQRLDWPAWDGGRCLALMTERCRHVHARVGYEHGPQVPDPSAPEFAPHLAAHFEWWDGMWSAAAKRGQAAFTVTPEFGPPDYLHTLPFTRAPVADLASVCRWMADRLVERYGGKSE